MSPFSNQQFRINNGSCLSSLDDHEDPQRVQVALAAAHEPARPSLREERSSGRRSRGVASANASRDRNHRITFRGSHPWNQPKICLRRRLRRQYILHLFAYNDVVVSRARACGVPCNSICKDQTNLTLPRAHRASLRRDIKDRAFQALFRFGHGADSLSDRCLHTCCFLARQLHFARKPWMIASSSSNNIWSYPLVLQLATLPNTWAMTSDMCGYGDKWRIRTGLLMGWIDSRNRHRFAKHCLTPKGAFLLSRICSLCPPAQCSTYLALFVDALAFVLSTSARDQPFSRLMRDSGLGDVVWRAVCSCSLELHIRRWPPHEPSFFCPCQASCSRQLLFFFCLAQQNEFLAPSLTHAECVQHDTRTRFLGNFTLYIHLHGIAASLSQLCFLHYFI